MKNISIYFLENGKIVRYRQSREFRWIIISCLFFKHDSPEIMKRNKFKNKKRKREREREAKKRELRME